MKKFVVTAALSAALAAQINPAGAVVNVAVAVPGSFAAGYATPQLVLSKSAPATLINLDIEPHDIRSTLKRPDGKLWFKSDVIGTGETAEIEGLATTPNGEYEFFCVVHASTMRGTATVVD
jgi:plastocyanin